jgi:hypothetical protein
MKLAALGVLSLVCVVLVACSDSKCKCGDTSTNGGAGPDGSMGGSSETTTVPDTCHDGCVETVAAACDNGPASQAQCEVDCRMLVAGKCGGEYQSLQACAEGKVISCDAQGLPAVEACSDQQAGFVACLTQ